VIRASRKIVLYRPQQVDESLGLPSSRDLLPLEMLAISGFPLQDGYEVEIIDGSLYSADEAHRRVLAACENAFLYGTTGILGHMVKDGFRVTRKVKHRYPDLPAVIGGWFASVEPGLQLRTGLYECVVLGQGEFTFREVVRAIDNGEPLDSIPGLAVLREGEVIETETRHAASWSDIPRTPWHLIDIESYKLHQLREDSWNDELRLPAPRSMGSEQAPYFGISYYSSFGCPEPCEFCCSPHVSHRRWKSMPAERILDDLEELKERWKFDVVRFHDANFGVHERRVRELAEGLLERDLRFKYNAFFETPSILDYDERTLDALAESGLYIAEIGAEAGTDETMSRIGKRITGDQNIEAAVEMDRRGVCASVTYVIGYPHEDADSMLATIDQARRLHVAAPLARPTVWPYRPIPGSTMWDQAIGIGYAPPEAIEEWGSIGEYHLDETWLGKIPPRVAEARKMYHHYVSLDCGLTRGFRGFWERRAGRRLADGSHLSLGARLEARLFHHLWRLRRALLGGR